MQTNSRVSVLVTHTGMRKYVWNLRNATSTCIPLKSICWAKLLLQKQFIH